MSASATRHGQRTATRLTLWWSGRIVGEVFVELLRADGDSYLSENPRWKRHLPSTGGPGVFRMTDLLNFAGVVVPLQ